MEEVVVFLLLGVGAGGLISGAGIGVVLSYRGSGLINLAVGAFSMLSGYCFWSLNTGYFGPKLATAPAVVVTFGFAVVIAIIFELIVIVPLRNASPLAKLVGSLGFLISAMAGVTVVFGSGAFREPAILPDRLLHLFGHPLLLNRFLIAALVCVLAIIALAIYRLTRFGLGTRASSENELHAVLAGLSPRWISLANTILMSLTMTVIGLAAASIQVLDPTDLPLLVVPGLAAALFGSLSSLTTTFVAGTVMGALQSLLLFASTLAWFPSQGPADPLPGSQELLTFLILVVAVCVRGGRIPGRGEVIERRLPAAPRPRAPARSALVYSVPAALCLWLFPVLYREALVASLIWMIMLLSIVLITGFVGQISAVQLALGGVAGFAAGEFTMQTGLGFPLGPLVGVAVAALSGFLLGIPALRVRGVSLVIVTLAAAVAFDNFFFGNNTIERGAAFLIAPGWFGFPTSASEFNAFQGADPSLAFSMMVLGVLVAAALFICNVRRSRMGQEMLAVRANERAAAAVGINVRNVKLVGFTLAATIAGIGGVLLSYTYGVVSLGNTDTVTTLTLIAFAYIGGITTIPGSVLAGLFLTGNLVTVCLQHWFRIQPTWVTLVAGLLLIVVLVWVPEGVGGASFYRSRRRASAVPGQAERGHGTEGPRDAILEPHAPPVQALASE